jgi:hypothetical protein
MWAIFILLYFISIYSYPILTGLFHERRDNCTG